MESDRKKEGSTEDQERLVVPDEDDYSQTEKEEKDRSKQDKIYGLENGFIINADMDTVIEVAGYGMDNNHPMEGERRDVPVSWSIENTYPITAPYTFVIHVRNPGDYQLRVLFEIQEYDGNKWSKVGEDVREISFTVVEAQDSKFYGPKKTISVNTNEKTKVDIKVLYEELSFITCDHKYSSDVFDCGWWDEPGDTFMVEAKKEGTYQCNVSLDNSDRPVWITVIAH